MIGDKIKELRKSRGLNQTEFAKPLFVTAGAVSQWEKGLTWPDTSRLMRISKVYGVPLGYFNDDPTDAEQIETAPPPQAPKTPEARILASGIDRMPERDRERALNLVRLMFEQYADYFDKGDNDET